MSLASVVRQAVAIANSVTSSVQSNVTLEAWTGQDGDTKPTYATGVGYPAIVEEGPKPFRTASGDTIIAKAIIHILGPVTSDGATGRQEPIDPRDRITLSSGVIGAPIVGGENLVDPSTNRPYFHSLALG